MERAPGYERETQLHALLLQSQWWPAHELRQQQAALLERLVRHARDTVPFYAARLAPLFTRRGHFNLGGWRDVVPLTRADVLEHFDALKTGHLPPEAGIAFSALTSGSTGSPVKVLKCRIQSLAAITASVRFMDWHGFDYRLPFVGIRPTAAGVADYPDGRTRTAHWGPYWLPAETRGPWQDLTIATPADRQLEWLRRRGRCYVNTLPVNLLTLAEAAGGDASLRPDLAGILTIGELVRPEHRSCAREVFGTRISDQYSTIECGVIAGECPVSGHMHVHAESMLLEAVRADGSPCETGEEGFASITPLYSYAMPLIRYVLSDLITVLEPCACGRGLPHISIAGGRLRSRFRFSDGTLVAADFRMSKNSALVGATRWQWAQVAPETLELRFVSKLDEQKIRYADMTALVQTVLGRPVTVRYKRLQAFPALPSGKHFDYVCELN